MVRKYCVLRWLGSWVLCACMVGVAVTSGFGQLVNGQNLVPNPSFEGHRAIPWDIGQWFYAYEWDNLNGDTTTWPYSSPDYFHIEGSGSVSVPHSAFAEVLPNSGHAMMGICVWNTNGDTENFREYIGVRLLAPLEVGRTYEVSFYMSNGANSTNLYAISNFGVLFSVDKPLQKEHEPIGELPQLLLPDIWFDEQWKKVSFKLLADKPFRYITLGNFFDDSDTVTEYITNLTPLISDSFDNSAYYFLDDVEVISIDF